MFAGIAIDEVLTFPAYDNPVNVAVNVVSAVAASCTAGAGPAHETNHDDEIHGEQLGRPIPIARTFNPDPPTCSQAMHLSSAAAALDPRVPSAFYYLHPFNACASKTFIQWALAENVSSKFRSLLFYFTVYLQCIERSTSVLPLGTVRTQSFLEG
jgi:hypothetical protein